MSNVRDEATHVKLIDRYLETSALVGTLDRELRDAKAATKIIEEKYRTASAEHLAVTIALAKSASGLIGVDSEDGKGQAT